MLNFNIILKSECPLSETVYSSSLIRLTFEPAWSDRVFVSRQILVQLIYTVQNKPFPMDSKAMSNR